MTTKTYRYQFDSLDGRCPLTYRFAHGQLCRISQQPCDASLDDPPWHCCLEQVEDDDEIDNTKI